MRKLSLNDIQTIEHTPTSSAALQTKIGTMIDRSTRCRARVETFDPDTGQYRIVLQGTLDSQDNPFEDTDW